MARYPPNYRAEFVRFVAQRVEFSVGYPKVRGGSEGFVDAVDLGEAHVLPLPTVTIGSFLRFGYVSLATLKHSYDCVVIQDRLTDPFGWALLVLRRLGLLPVSVVVFGFGYRDSSFLSGLRNWLVRGRSRMADHVVTYMEAGRRNLVSRGVNPCRVTMLGNATNTEALRVELRAQPAVARPRGLSERRLHWTASSGEGHSGPSSIGRSASAPTPAARRGRWSSCRDPRERPT